MVWHLAGSTFRSSGNTSAGGGRHCTIRTDRATAPRKMRKVLSGRDLSCLVHRTKKRPLECLATLFFGHEIQLKHPTNFEFWGQCKNLRFFIQPPALWLTWLAFWWILGIGPMTTWLGSSAFTPDLYVSHKTKNVVGSLGPSLKGWHLLTPPAAVRPVLLLRKTALDSLRFSHRVSSRTTWSSAMRSDPMEANRSRSKHRRSFQPLEDSTSHVCFPNEESEAVRPGLEKICQLLLKGYLLDQEMWQLQLLITFVKHDRCWVSSRALHSVHRCFGRVRLSSCLEKPVDSVFQRLSKLVEHQHVSKPNHLNWCHCFTSIEVEVSWSQLKSVEVSWSQLKSVEVSWSQLKSVEVSWSQLKSVEVSWSQLKSVEVSWSQLKSVEVSWSQLKSVEVSWSQLKSVEVSWSQLKSVEVSWSQLKSVEVSWSQLKSVEVSWSQLKSVEVSWSQLKSVEVSWSQLKSVEVSWSQLKSGMLLQGLDWSIRVHQSLAIALSDLLHRGFHLHCRVDVQLIQRHPTHFWPRPPVSVWTLWHNRYVISKWPNRWPLHRVVQGVSWPLRPWWVPFDLQRGIVLANFQMSTWSNLTCSQTCPDLDFGWSMWHVAIFGNFLVPWACRCPPVQWLAGGPLEPWQWQWPYHAWYGSKGGKPSIFH